MIFCCNLLARVTKNEKCKKQSDTPVFFAVITSLANLVTHQTPCSVVTCFVFKVLARFCFPDGCSDVRTLCVKLMTTYRPVLVGQ